MLILLYLDDIIRLYWNIQNKLFKTNNQWKGHFAHDTREQLSLQLWIVIPRFAWLMTRRYLLRLPLLASLETITACFAILF
jgi:hypothetical protein